MKTYQIKIEVKKVTPLVWRRCIIPAGITFAQLSVILNAITGWDRERYYEFEFYHRRQQLREKHDNVLFQPNWRYDLLEASETYIDEFMEQEEWFSYLTQEDCKYRVIIEKTIEGNDAFPCILKYKGECQQAVSVGSLDEVNAELKRKFSVTYGDMCFQKQGELYEKLARGEYGLCGSKNPVNDEKKIYKSADSIIKDMAEMIHNKCMDAVRNYMEQKEIPPEKEPEKNPKRRRIMVKEALSCYSREDLLDYAKELGISRVSGLKKSGLAEKIANEILSPSVMKKRMSILSDEQIQLFEELIGCERLYDPTEAEKKKLQMFYIWDYVVTDYQDLIEVPVDVEEVYKKISTPEFHESRQKAVWMKKCLRVFVALYVVAPVWILRRLYRRNAEIKTEKGELLKIFHMLPEEENPCVLVGDRIVYKEVLKDKLYLKIEERQGEKDYYIPSVEEIEDYSENGYFSKEQSYQKMGEFLRNVLHADRETADYMLHDIFQKVNIGENLQDIVDECEENGIVFPSEKTVFDFCELMEEVSNNTRMFDNRGYKPWEIYNRMVCGERMPVIVPGSTIPTFTFSKEETQAAARKIYPNDPCPCGSGKKYKKCCGRL